MSQCPKCGTENRAGANFCKSCRAPLAAQSAPQPGIAEGNKMCHIGHVYPANLPQCPYCPKPGMRGKSQPTRVGKLLCQAFYKFTIKLFGFPACLVNSIVICKSLVNVFINIKPNPIAMFALKLALLAGNRISYPVWTASHIIFK